MKRGATGGNGSGNGKRVPWNKGKRDPRAGTSDSPWGGNGGPGRNGGRRPGAQNAETVERGFRLEEIGKRLRERHDVEPLFGRLYLSALAGDVKAAGLFLAYAIGKPKETVAVEEPTIPAGGAQFRCFTSDGRPLPSPSLPVPAKPNPST